MLRTSEGPLARVHDTTVLDLDGVVYVGDDAVPGAPDHLVAAQAQGTHLAYVTNNASRTPDAVHDKLAAMGVPVGDGDVVTSAQAAARLLRERLPAGSAVYLIGGDGLDAALREQDLVPVTSPDDDPAAVVQGYAPDVPWGRVVAGAVLVRGGLPWVASNTDMTFPTAHGLGPGNGTLVSLLARFAERDPEVAGKPAPPLLEETQRRVGGATPLMVGDRLDTDVAGAVNVDWPSLLVLTGVTGLTELVAARPGERPTYLSADLGGLLATHRAPSAEQGGYSAGGWLARVVDGELEVTGEGEVDEWWRAAACAAWAHLDQTGDVAGTRRADPPVADG